MKNSHSAIFIFTCFLACNVWAHRVNVFAWTEGETISVSSKFAGGSVARGASVSVRDDRGNEVITGKTNNEGVFRFTLPKSVQTQRLDITVNAGEGHQNTWRMESDDLPVLPAAALPSSTQSESTALTAPVSSCEQAVAQALTRQEKEVIAPLRDKLRREAERGPGMLEIGAGIGWMIGLFSLLAWWRRKKS